MFRPLPLTFAFSLLAAPFCGAAGADSLASSAPAAAALDQPSAEALEIINSQTTRHVKFPNFDYAIILPNTGYREVGGTLMPGFANETDGVEIDITQSAGAYVPAQGSPVSVFRYRINGADAVLYKRQLPGQGRKESRLVYGAESLPLQIRATYPDSVAKFEADVDRAVLSVVYTGPEKNRGGRFVNSAFSISAEGFEATQVGTVLTLFKHKGLEGRSNIGGVDERVYFQVMRQLMDVPLNKQKKTAVSLVQGMLPQGWKITDRSAFVVPGLEGFQFLTQHLLDDGRPDEGDCGFAAVLFDDHQVIIFFSEANVDCDNNISLFRKIAESIRKED